MNAPRILRKAGIAAACLWYAAWSTQAVPGAMDLVAPPPAQAPCAPAAAAHACKCCTDAGTCGCCKKKEATGPTWRAVVTCAAPGAEEALPGFVKPMPHPSIEPATAPALLLCL